MASLKLYYGPYFSMGILKHRQQKIRGLLSE